MEHCVNFLKAEEHLEPSQTSKMELLAKTANSWKSFIIFAESSSLHVLLDSRSASEKRTANTWE